MKHYSISEIKSIDDLRTMFPDGEANYLNFVLFSTSGIHGSYLTLEDIQDEPDDEEHRLTVLVIRPRIVETIYGTIVIDKTDIPWLMKLRASSLKAVSTIGVAARQVGGDAKPAVFYCDNGKSLKGLEQGALAVLSNLMIETNATSADFMIGNKKDGEFHFHCTRGKADAPADLDALKADASRNYSRTDYCMNNGWRYVIGWTIDHLASTGRLSGVTKS